MGTRIMRPPCPFCDKRDKHIAELEGQLAAVRPLPDKWREDEAEQRSVGCSPWMDANHYAKELEAAIAGEQE